MTEQPPPYENFTSQAILRGAEGYGSEQQGHQGHDLRIRQQKRAIDSQRCLLVWALAVPVQFFAPFAACRVVLLPLPKPSFRSWFLIRLRSSYFGRQECSTLLRQEAVTRTCASAANDKLVLHLLKGRRFAGIWIHQAYDQQLAEASEPEVAGELI